MRKKDALQESLSNEAEKVKFNGVYIPNSYLYDKNLNGNMKLLLAILLDIENNYGNRIIKVVYLARLLSISDATVSKELKKLEDNGYIESKIVTHKNIALGKKFKVLIKPGSEFYKRKWTNKE